MTDLAPLGIGIVGLGRATMFTLPTLVADARFRIAGAADVVPEARQRFASDFDVPVFASVEELCEAPAVDAVYIATPHAFHAAQALAAAERGKHVLIEKPLALTIEDCLAVHVAAVRHGVHVVVGHTHAFDRPVLGMWDMLRSGRLGRLAMINTWNYGAFLYRPRRADELDTARGGGIIYNQVPHQVDVVRLLGGGLVHSVRAATWRLDETRPTEGSYATFLRFASGAAATLVYSGYDYFDSDELHGWVGESGEPRPAGRHGAARRALRTINSTEAEESLKQANGYAAAGWHPAVSPERRHQAHFGLLVVSCAGGDLRTTPDGFMVYDEEGAHEVTYPADGPYPDRTTVLDELHRAVTAGVAPVHDAAWGAATMEVCTAILLSARENREVELTHQVAADPSHRTSMNA